MEASSRFLNSELITRHKAGLNGQLVEKDRDNLFKSIAENLKLNNATLISHYYVDPLIQQITEETNGFIGDSLEMAKFGSNCQTENLIVCGVKFMAETAKILSPEKHIYVPTYESTCSLDLGCPAADLKIMKDKYPERKLVVYANTSAEVKAMADWVVTSSIAREIIEELHLNDKKILWAPDKYLGSYLQKETGADMLLWDSACVVHEEFKAKGLKDLMKIYPDAAVLVHPESPDAVIELADVVGSTSAIIKGASSLPNDQFIVATDRGIFHRLLKDNPSKRFIEAPTGGNGATCRSCAHCPWMAMNELRKVNRILEDPDHRNRNEIKIDTALVGAARKPLDRMLSFSA